MEANIRGFEQQLPFLVNFLPSLTELYFLVALHVLAGCGTQLRRTGSPVADIRIAVMPTRDTRLTWRKETNVEIHSFREKRNRNVQRKNPKNLDSKNSKSL